jgi:hypothetical protein
MNLPRDEISACVLTGLPNIRDYFHRQRDMLLEKKTVGSGNSEKPKNDPQQEHQDNKALDENQALIDNEALNDKPDQNITN